ncbi:hypothetical protein FRC11_002102, partial [Ceratobasidium sp. 423]
AGEWKGVPGTPWDPPVQHLMCLTWGNCALKVHIGASAPVVTTPSIKQYEASPVVPIQTTADTDTETEAESGTEAQVSSTSGDVINITDLESEDCKAESSLLGFSAPSNPYEAPEMGISDTEQTEGEDEVPPIHGQL